jgi:hypothetical protein
MEDLRRKYSWWPSGASNAGEPIALIDMEAATGKEDGPRSITRTTKL